MKSNRNFTFLLYFCLGIFLIALTNTCSIPSIQTASFSSNNNLEIDFPADAGFVNVRSFGAKGDGVTDDTAAIQTAIDKTYTYNGGHPNNFRILYLPNGIYSVSNEISWRRWVTIQGQSQIGTIIKLKNNTQGYEGGQVKPVLHAYFSNNESFANYIQNLTVDTGAGNPGAIGIRYNNHNEGMIGDVTIRSGDGRGQIGLDLTENEFGPALIKNMTVEGFNRGVVTVGSVSHATFLNLTLKNQSVVGFDNNLPVSIYNLVSQNTVPAIVNSSFYLAHVVLVKASLTGGSSTNAIENQGGFYGRDITIDGYKNLLNDSGTIMPGPTLKEYVSKNDEQYSLFLDEGKKGHLQIPYEVPPSAFVEPVNAWVKPQDIGEDDTIEIQKIFDSGTSTIYFPFGKHYSARRTITIPATVRRVIGMHNGPSTSFGNYNDYLPEDQPIIRIVGDTKEPLVLESFFASRWPYNETRPGIEIASNRPVYIRSSGGGVIHLAARYSGSVWLEDTHTDIRIHGKQTVRAVHYNPENNQWTKDRTYVINKGGTFWCLGMKTEAIAKHVDTQKGGRTEILGGFFRDHKVLPGDSVPYFSNTDGAISATYLQYDWGGGNARGSHAVETKGATTKELKLSRGNHRIGMYRG
jgi:Pectate lyase superfamily protein